MTGAMATPSTVAYDTAQSGVSSARSALSSGDQKKLKKSCDDFESMFITMMMREMDKTVHQESMFSGGKGEEMFSDMKTMAISQKIAEGSSFGLSEALYGQLSAQAEEAQAVRAEMSATETKE